MTDFAAARRNMVDGQIRPANVTDLRIISAMLGVPRERFIPPALSALAYLDFEVPVGERGPNVSRRLLRPMVLAKLIQAAEPADNDQVLDIGCATGYGAAVLARIAGRVTALEEDSELAEAAKESLAGEPQVSVVTGPLSEGWPQGAAYDVILLEGAVERVPPALFKQLAASGRLLCVLGSGPVGRAMLYRCAGEETGGRAVFDAAAAVLPGFVKPVEFAF